MRLRKKTLLAVLVVLGALIGTVHIVLSKVLLDRFRVLESEAMAKDIQRARKVFVDEVKQLSTKTHDWSAWDDSYQFVQDQNQAYIESNLQMSTLTNLNIDDILFFDTNQNFVTGLRFLLNGKTSEGGFRAQLLSRLSTQSGIESLKADGDQREGFIVLDDAIVIIAAQPILQSDGVGPSKGTIVFTKLVTDHLIRKVGNEAELLIDLVRYDRLPAVRRAELPPALPNDTLSLQRVLDEDSIIGFAGIRGLDGTVNFVLRVHASRGIFLQGQTTLHILVLCLVSAGLIVSVLIAFLLDSLVISRLQNLCDQVTSIADDGDSAKRVSIPGKDELVVVCSAINTMLSALNKSEKELRVAKEVAESATRARAQFVANMSHELRTPINGIFGMAQILERLPLGANERRYAEMISKSSISLLGIINDVLDFSKIDAGKLELEETTFSLRSVVHDTLQGIATRAQEKGLELIGSVDTSVPDTLNGDPLRFRQVITNLCGNAIKFTAEGEVHLSVRVEEQSADSLTLHCIVRDTGIGIPPNKVNSVFEAFSQADGSTSRQYGGTGLGLSISKDIVELMGGRIWAESEVGIGTEFHFTAIMKYSNAVIASKSLADKSVILVDDCDAYCSSLDVELRAAGADVTVYKSWSDDILTDCRPDATFIIDAELHDSNGMARIIHLLKGLEHLVILTSPAIRADILEAAEHQWKVPLLLKPLLASDLVKGIHDPGSFVRKESVESSAAPSKALTILVADDVGLNREVLRLMLEPRGHTVLCASNGREVLEILNREINGRNCPVDILLLDSQMPIMDGFETARRIREDEDRRSHGAVRLPIIAVTANALEGDRDKLLEAGLDDYIAKPVFADTLYAKLQQFVPDLLTSEIVVTDSQHVSERSILDLAELRERLGNNDTLVREMVELFLEEEQELMDSLVAAVQSGEPEKIRRSAHALKGSLANISAHNGMDAASEMERAAAAGAGDSDRELQALLAKLSELRAHIARSFPSRA